MPTIHWRARLPPELVDAIIELLCDDRAALATCSLVCRSWVPASRHHLFSVIVINPDGELDASVLLSSPLCTLASAAQHLMLYTIESLNSLPEITCRLAHITQLTLRQSCFLSGTIFPPTAMVPFLRNLESLQLENIIFQADDILLLLLRSCSRLRALSCGGVSLRLPTELDTGDNLRPLPTDQDRLIPGLTLLKAHASAAVLYWLVARWATAAPRLTTLDLNFFPSLALTESVGGLLQEVGSTLQVLRISPGNDELSRISQSFPLLSQLHSCSFDTSPWISDPNRGVRFMRHALPRLASPQLRELIFTLSSATYSELDHGAWSELGLLLETPRFLSALRTLSFRFQKKLSPIDPQAARVRAQWIAETFPLCAARGILHVESWD